MFLFGTHSQTSILIIRIGWRSWFYGGGSLRKVERVKDQFIHMEMFLITILHSLTQIRRNSFPKVYLYPSWIGSTHHPLIESGSFCPDFSQLRGHIWKGIGETGSLIQKVVLVISEPLIWFFLSTIWIRQSHHMIREEFGLRHSDSNHIVECISTFPLLGNQFQFVFND